MRERAGLAGRAAGAEDIAVVGAGHVGLPTAAVLAHLGHRVVCGDSDADRVRRLARGEVPIVEDRLDELVRDGLDSGRLRFVHGAAAAVADAAFVFLCVPTPQRPDGSADLAFVEAVAKEIAPHLAVGAIVVNKSTVPVGSTLVVERVLARADVVVVSNPEFLREGTAVRDSLQPDRIVVGADDQAAAARVGSLFAGVQAPLIVTDAATAETIKYASNAFLATKLSFVNALASVCEAVGADVRDVVLGLGYDHRIGFEYLRPGPGWGGSCLPKDTRALVHLAKHAGEDFPLLRSVIDGNEAQFDRMAAKVAGALGTGPAGRELSGVAVAVWGLSFKAGTDDMRHSPAVEVVCRLVGRGASVRAFDPALRDLQLRRPSAPSQTLADVLDGQGVVPVPGAESVAVVDDAYAACDGAHGVVVLTEWEELRWLDFGEVRRRVARPVIVDTRNLLDPVALRRMGFTYSGVGRP